MLHLYTVLTTVYKWNILVGHWTIKLGTQTAGHNESLQRFIFVLTQLHFGQWSSLPFCLPSLIVQWPARFFCFQLQWMIVILSYWYCTLYCRTVALSVIRMCSIKLEFESAMQCRDKFNTEVYFTSETLVSSIKFGLNKSLYHYHVHLVPSMEFY